MAPLRKIYTNLLPYETRFWLYKLRHLTEFQDLLTRVNHHEKGDFSLRGYTRHQMIFVHITKTAGTSVALSLFGELPYHYTASQYRVIFGRRSFNQYFKFAFVRNPWDRLYSAFSYLKGGGWDTKDAAWVEQNLKGIEDFNQFVTEWLTQEKLNSHKHFWPQSRFVCDWRGRPLIDYLGYFETIAIDFDRIAQRLELDASLGHTNSSRRASYQEIYSSEAREKVARLYADDIKNFGYRFDGFDRKTVLNGRFLDHG